MSNIYFEMLNPLMWEVAPKPTPTFSFNRSWWSDLPLASDDGHVCQVGPLNTIKNCPAVSDTISSGYVVYCPVDVSVNATEQNLQISTPSLHRSELSNLERNLVGQHTSKQMSGFSAPEGYHNNVIKINTFWGIRTDPGYSVLITKVLNRNDLPYIAVDAIVDTDSYTSRFPYSLWIQNNFNGIIRAGSPLFQVIPFKREDWKMNLIQFPDKESHTIQDVKISTMLNNGYRRFFWKKKRFK